MGGNSVFLSSFWHLHFRGNLGGAREGAKPKKQLILSQSPTFLLRHMTRRHDDDVGEGGGRREGRLARTRPARLLLGAAIRASVVCGKIRLSANMLNGKSRRPSVLPPSS